MKQQTVFNEIRTRCRAVANQARHVHIAAERIPEYIAPLLVQTLDVPTIEATSHFVGENEPTIAFFTTLAAVNFGSGYFPHLNKRPGMSGYYTIATALTEHFRSRGAFTAVELSQITSVDCASLFSQDGSDPVIGELMSLFAQAWNDLGGSLSAKYDGQFTTLIEAAEHSAGKLVELMADQPLFRDVSHYHGINVPFYKRSQLLASDLSLALKGKGLGHFEDLDQLTIFADNLVPHVLRLDGILQYEPTLLNRIEAEQLIPAGSDEEIEIRACCIHAVELMIQAAAEVGVHWTARDVDQVLWHQGQHPRYKQQNKRHRTRTVFY